MTLTEYSEQSESRGVVRRRCMKCGEMKSPAEFDGISRRCRECRRAYQRAWAAKNKELTNERNRASYRRNKPAYAARVKKYVQRLREDARSDLTIQSKILVKAARHRAKKRGVPFNITSADVPIPANCPVFGFPLVVRRGAPGPDSPTIDRIEPAKGYVKGNVIVVSMKANVAKSDLTPDELFRLWSFYNSLKERPL